MVHGRPADLGGGVRRTSFRSFRLVSITMVAVFCSQIMRQKSATVSSFGPGTRPMHLYAPPKKTKSNPVCPTLNFTLRCNKLVLLFKTLKGKVNNINTLAISH